MTKRTLAIFTLIFTILLSGEIVTTPAFAQNLNAVVAVVNNGVITQTELNNAISEAKQQLAAGGNPQAISQAQLKKMVLKQLIDEKLQLELAKQAKVTVTDAEVTQAITHIAAQNHLTLSSLKDKLQQQNMSYTAYRQMIHKQLLIHKIQQTGIGAEPKITAQDLKEALTQYQMHVNTQQAYHLIDIVAPTKQDAEKFMVQLKNGVDIQSSNPQNFHDLGWQTQNTLPSIFVKEIASMKTGDIAGPIQAPNGFHVIKLVGVQGNSATPTKQQLENIAYQMKFQQAVKKWLVQLRKTAYIKINGDAS